MMKDKSIILLIILSGLILGYFIFFYARITFELKKEVIHVNIHETINLKSQIYKAKNDNGRDLTNKIKFSGEIGESDKLDGEKLYIGDFSTKTITYTLKYKFKTVTRTLEIVVISDPNDPGFKPVTDYEETDINNDDIPNNQVNTNLTESQKNYVDSLLK